ncbi:MAG: HDOD domain-containing protein, partial [Nitrospinaceae bacterium]|nr:HDOD domain-containing protein [Nitrospinaceae bacterium]
YAERITSLHQAAGLLGPGAIRNLVLTTPILERFQDPVYVEREMDFQKIWLHASVTGALAGSLAGRIGNLEPDVCFTAGLIHPVGTIALAVHHPRILLEVLQLAEKQGGSRVDAERRVLGFTHAEVAADMAAAANFPPALVQSVRSLAASEGEDEGPSMGALVQLARSLAIEWGYADGLGREVPVDRKRLLAVFKISAGDLIKWTPQLKEFVNPAVQALG